MPTDEGPTGYPRDDAGSRLPPPASWGRPVLSALRQPVGSAMTASTKKRPPTPPPGAVVPKVALSYEEAAWSLGISRSKLYRLVSEGRLPCVVIDGNTVLRLEDLEKFVAGNVTIRGQEVGRV